MLVPLQVLAEHCVVNDRHFFAFRLQRAFPPIAFAVLRGHSHVVEYLLNQDNFNASLSGVRRCKCMHIMCAYEVCVCTYMCDVHITEMHLHQAVHCVSIIKSLDSIVGIARKHNIC